MTEENKQELVIQDVENKVAEITKFDVTRQQLEEKVVESKKIVITDYRDKEQIAVVTKACKEMRGIEITIEKKGKSYRDVFTKVNRDIKDKQDILLKVTNPEVARLNDLKERAEEVRIQDERKAKLPERQEKLGTIGCHIDYTDESLNALNDIQFEAYYNECLQEKLGFDKIEAEKKRLADEAKLQADRDKIAEDKRLADEEAALKAQTLQDAIDEEAKRVAGEVEAKRLADQAVIDAENAKIVAEKKAIEDEKAEIARQKELKIAEERAAEKAREEAEMEAKVKAEKMEAEKLAEEERLKKVEAMRPDKEKLVAYADALLAVTLPELATREAKEILEMVGRALSDLTQDLRK